MTASFAAGAAGAAVAAAERLRARAIITLAGSGLTALHVSKWLPALPIVALSSAPATLRRLNLLRGVRPVELPHHADMEEQLAIADQFLLEVGWAKVGDVMVTVGALPFGAGRETNTIRFHRVRLPGTESILAPPSQSAFGIED
jgi:pyruvate kinase